MKRTRRQERDFRKIAFVSAILTAALALSIGSPFAELRSAGVASAGSSAPATEMASATGSATGLPPDSGTLHVLFWILLGAALIPVELELRRLLNR